MRIDMDEAYVYRSRTITPLKKLAFLIPRVKELPKCETPLISCVRSVRVASNGFGETCTILSMVPTFNCGTSGDFGHRMVYG
jgi:hypothetical protein